VTCGPLKADKPVHGGGRHRCQQRREEQPDVQERPAAGREHGGPQEPRPNGTVEHQLALRPEGQPGRAAEIVSQAAENFSVNSV